MKLEKREDRRLKYQALYWLRIKQRCPFIATEVGSHAADVIGVSEKKMIEIEVKISLADLKNDFKKHKHWYYSGEGLSVGATVWQGQWVPTHFYYAVPEKLIEQAKELLSKERYEKYGIINSNGWVVVKRAKWLHEREPNSHVKFVTALRMGSELLRFHESWI